MTHGTKLYFNTVGAFCKIRICTGRPKVPRGHPPHHKPRTGFRSCPGIGQEALCKPKYHSPLEGESERRRSLPSIRWGANAASRECSPQLSRWGANAASRESTPRSRSGGGYTPRPNVSPGAGRGDGRILGNAGVGPTPDRPSPLGAAVRGAGVAPLTGSAFAINLAGACPRRRTRSRLWLALCEPPTGSAFAIRLDLSDSPSRGE